MEHTKLTARESAYIEGRDEERLADLAGRIRERDREDQQLANLMLVHAVEKGRWLTEAKSLVPHGAWGEWLKREVDYSQSKAQTLMRLFQRHGEDGQESLFGASKSQALGNLTYSQAVCLLPLQDGPELEEFLETHDVENMSTRALNAEVRAARRERDEALERQEALAQANAQLAEQSSRAKAAQAEAQRLSAELEELKARPVDVVVETDANALQAARKEAEEAMRAKLDEAKAAAEQARQELERARAEAAALREQAEGKRAAQTADEDLALFRALFKQMQEMAKQMGGMLAQFREKDPEKAPGLTNAVLDLADRIREVAAQ